MVEIMYVALQCSLLQTAKSSICSAHA